MLSASGLRMRPSWHPMQFGDARVFSANPAIAVVSGGDIASLADAYAAAGRATLTRSGGASTGHPQGTVSGLSTITETSGRDLRATSAGVGTGEQEFDLFLLVQFTGSFGSGDYRSAFLVGRTGDGSGAALGTISADGVKIWGGGPDSLYNDVPDADFEVGVGGTIAAGEVLLLELSYTIGQGRRIRVRGRLGVNGSNGSVPQASPAMNILHDEFGFVAYSGTHIAPGEVLWADLFDRVLTARERFIYERELRTRIKRLSGGAIDITLPAQLPCLGTSQTAGGHTSDVDHAYPALLATALGAGVDVWNKGHSGDTIADMLARLEKAAVSSGLAPVSLMIVEAGINDILTGRTGAQAYADYVTLCQAAIGYGCTPIAMTLPPEAWTDGSRPADATAQRLAFNAALRAGYRSDCGAVLLLEPDTLPAFSDPTSATYYDSDRLHWLDAAHAALSAYAAPLIAGVVPS